MLIRMLSMTDKMDIDRSINLDRSSNQSIERSIATAHDDSPDSWDKPVTSISMRCGAVPLAASGFSPSSPVIAQPRR